MKNTTFRATGMSHYPEAIEAIRSENDDYKLSKRELLEIYEPGEKVWKYDYIFHSVELIPEPENEYDPNAVAVYVDGKKIAHIKRGSCTQVKNLISADGFVKVEAEIGGGPYKYIFEDEDEHISIDKNESEVFVHITIYNDRQPVKPAKDPSPEKIEVSDVQEAPKVKEPKKHRILKIICLIGGILLILLSLIILLIDKIGFLFLITGIVGIVYGIRK